jgi:hypothetical protein
MLLRINLINDIMKKCNECGFENKDTAKFCSKCGKPLGMPANPENKNTSKIIIVALVIIILILAVSIGYFVLTNNSQGSQAQSASSNTGNNAPNNNSQQAASTQSVQQKEWKLIGTYSGSGSGSQSISVPPGEIMIKISAYPIKNYATNHLYVSGAGQSVGVDWGSTSDVETRSDSKTFNLSSQQTFKIDYYETVSWQVEFYRYQ